MSTETVQFTEMIRESFAALCDQGWRYCPKCWTRTQHDRLEAAPPALNGWVCQVCGNVQFDRWDEK
jgi:hypothetical protein